MKEKKNSSKRHESEASNAGAPPVATELATQQAVESPPSHPPSSPPPSEKAAVSAGPETVQIDKVELEALKHKAQEAESWLNMLKRVKADFENFQKRIAREKEENYKYVAQSVLCDILPVLDNLERAAASASTAENIQAIADGVKAIHLQLRQVLEKHNVKPIESCGTQFDPAYHEAVCCVETADGPDFMVLEELEKGYLLHDRVLRPAKVKVARRKTPDAQEAPAEVKGCESDTDKKAIPNSSPNC